MPKTLSTRTRSHLINRNAPPTCKYFAVLCDSFCDSFGCMRDRNRNAHSEWDFIGGTAKLVKAFFREALAGFCGTLCGSEVLLGPVFLFDSPSSTWYAPCPCATWLYCPPWRKTVDFCGNHGGLWKTQIFCLFELWS